MNQQEETELARALLAGESDAFEHFVQYFRSKVFRYSWLVCGQPDDAEEVAQETLLRVFQSLDQLREPEHIRAWVFRIARNVCLMQRRKSVFAPSEEVSLEALPAPAQLSDDAPPADLTLLQHELRAILDRVILELPASTRPVVLLRDIEQLSTEETAQILDLSQDVVKTRLHRGRQAMRQKLDCYLHNQCLEDQPSPDATPLTPVERETLYSEWRNVLHTRL
ncbi:MAG TPA: sigma-70 family RNA polymerase sigma factor [Candidatus Sulfopaludibacter sp.]|nr:sigma-70 family RNA polymerase sigma factor [Candidatus Sulfopaludibacter sp.]